MDLFAIRRRDRAHGVVATALWEALGSAGASPSVARAPRGRPAYAPLNQRGGVASVRRSASN